MANATLTDYLRLCVQRSKTYTNAQVLELNEAVIGALEEIINVLETKADSATVTTSLARKADAQATNAALNSKADSTEMSRLLGLKANSSDVSGLINFFNSSGLYIDEDGDIAQE